MELTDIKELYRSCGDFTGREVTVGGWVRSNRDSKNFGFLVINDGTFFEPLQVVYGDGLSNFEEIRKVNVGAALIDRYQQTSDPVGNRKLHRQRSAK